MRRRRSVPLDYDKPAARRSRSRSRACPRPTRRTGSARCSSTPAARAARASTTCSAPGPFLYTDEVRARFDLVGFDPRGDHPQHAAALLRRRSRVAAVPAFAFPLTPEQEQELDRRSTARSTRACAKRGGPIMRPHVDRQRGARPRRAARAGRRRAAQLRRRLLRLLPRCHLRQPVPGPRARAGRRRRAGPDRVVDRPRAARARGSRSRRGCAATSAPSRRCRSSSGCATPAGRGARSPGSAAKRFATLARAPARGSRSRSSSPTASTETVDYTLLIGITLGALYDSIEWPDFARWLAFVEAAPTGRASALRAERSASARGRRTSRRAGSPRHGGSRSAT